MSQKAEINLTQREILHKLMEEAAEVVQACAKALNHGLESAEPGTSAPTNSEKIAYELGELEYYKELGARYGVITLGDVYDSTDRKAKRPTNYHHYIPE